VSATEVVVVCLLTVGVAVLLASVLGVLVARDVYDRLHFTGPGAFLAPICFAAAVVLDEGALSQAGLKSILVALLMLGLNPILVHATARAARVRERGRLDYTETGLGHSETKKS
jgi:monovalent cation/proton antiporter MnhG/PhaG subunit